MKMNSDSQATEKDSADHVDISHSHLSLDNDGGEQDTRSTQGRLVVPTEHEPSISGTFDNNTGMEERDGAEAASGMRRRKPSGERTVVSLIFQDSTESSTVRERESQRKHDLFFAWTMLLSMLYAVTVVLVGVAFPITEALRHEWLTSQTVAVFNVYCDGVAIVFLIYVSICLWLDNKKDIRQERDTSKNQNLVHNKLKDSGDLIIHVKKQPLWSDEAKFAFDNDGYEDTISKRESEFSSPVIRPFSWNRPDPTRMRRSISAEANLCDYGIDMRPAPGMGPNVRVPGTILDQAGPGGSVAGDSFRGPFQEASVAGCSFNSEGQAVLPLEDDIYERVMVLRQTATLGHESASFYLRLGALLFGIGNFVYICIQIEFYVVEVSGKCDDYPVIYPMYLHLIFLVIQTFFIFKNTKVHVRRHKGLARFGFSHVLATNMCIWLRILVMEVMDGIHDGLEHENTTEHDPEEPVESQFFDAHHENVTYCMHQDGLFLRSAPYLFPFVLEYSLIAVAVMAGMYHALNIRVSQDILHDIKKAVKNDIKQNKLQVENRSPASLASSNISHGSVEDTFFAKSHRGLFMGAIVMTGTILGVIMFFNFSNRNQKAVAMEVYYITDIILHLILIPPVIGAFHVFRHFKFTFNRDNTIDHILLLVSLCGIVIYYIFILLVTASYLSFDEFDDIDDVITVMSMVAAVLNVIQSLVQGLFVIAGLQTCAVTEDQESKKPGRGIITFLIVGNIALWIFKTLQVKQTGMNRFAEFYGITAWPIIVNTNLPLALFYRFHASVCLADMWTSAYKPEEGPRYQQIL